VTTFLLNHEIDKGAILAQTRLPILPQDNAGTLYEKLMTAGVALVTRTVERIAAGDITPVEQQYADEATLRPAPKIFKEDCRIDWTLPGRRIVDFIRGLAPYPAAWSDLIREEGDRKDGTAPGGESGGAAGDGLSVKIFSAAFEAAAHGLRPGTVASDGRTEIRIACADGWIIPGELQLAGKKRLPAARTAARLARRKPIPLRTIVRPHTGARPDTQFTPAAACGRGESVPGTTSRTDRYTFADLPFDLLLRQRLRAEKPVAASHPLGQLSPSSPFIGTITSSTRPPVGRQRDPEGVDGLQSDQHPLDLVEIAPQRQRIADHGPQQRPSGR